MLVLVPPQIYNEMIRDLLNPSSGFLDLREDSKGEIQVAGITEVSTINAREVGLSLRQAHTHTHTHINTHTYRHTHTHTQHM